MNRRIFALISIGLMIVSLACYDSTPIPTTIPPTREPAKQQPELAPLPRDRAVFVGPIESDQ